MSDQATAQFPKPIFRQTGVLYDAIVSQGMHAASVSLDRADTVMRAMNKNSDWKAQHSDIIGTWIRGGDPWMDLIKSVRAHATNINKHLRAIERETERARKAEIKAQQRADKAGAKNATPA